MQTRNVPVTGVRYWIGMSAASVFGVNMGDYLSRIAHLGDWKGLPVMALLFVLLLAAERRVRPGIEAMYWLAVALERTAATNIADQMTHDFDWHYGLVLTGLGALLAGIIALGGVVPPRSARDAALPATGGMELANWRYWLAMLVAESLGTALSDAFSDWLDLSFYMEWSVLAAMFAVVFGLRTQPAFTNRLTYWLAVLVVGTCGPTIGDWLAHSGHLRLSTALTGVFFVGLLAVWPRDRVETAA